MDHSFVIQWDTADVARALGISEADVTEYMTDGRRISFLLERRIRSHNDGWSLAASEGASYDLLDSERRKWEVRSLSRGGIYFTPSNQVGAGRRFDEAGLLAKLDSIEGFLVTDITKFPTIPVFSIPARIVADWYSSGLLGVNARVSYARFYTVLLPTLGP